MYYSGVPKYLVDVKGDGNCLFYCLLTYLVKAGLLEDEWNLPSKPVMWIRELLRSSGKDLPRNLWAEVTGLNSDEFVNEELNRIFVPKLDLSLIHI